ncbi:hemagglutinin repeat-containing protein, partial [Aliarcobacter skirrowii]|uniref:hemagglutinin repeat-containing protein n=1 Tax=Aliarcobacter skirrowii TaxID=28200 RepID=UPI000B272A49
NNVNIDVKNDANFIGANVRAEDTLNLNVGNNLIVESLRDESSSNQSGFNVNAGIGLGSGGKESHRAPSTDIGKVSSANAGLSMNNGVSQSKQTVLSSITGNEVNINVDGNTHLKGSLISSDEDNLNFTTNTLTFANSSNSSYSSSTNIGTNLNYNLDDKKVENKEEKPQQKGISSVGYNSSNSLEADASKTLATLGTGNIIIKDKENSDDMDRLNRDKDNVNKDLYSSQTGTKVDATLDTRLLTKEGQEQIAKDFTEVKDTIKIISNSVSNYFDTKNAEENKQKLQQALVDLKVKDPQQYEDTMVAMRELDRILKEQPQNISNDERLAALPLALIPPLIYELLISAGVITTVVALTEDNRNNLVGGGINGEEQSTLLNLAVTQDKRVKNSRTGETGYEQDDGSIMVKDRAGVGHGGSAWKRYKNKKEWESKNAQREGTYDENGNRLRD